MSSTLLHQAVELAQAGQREQARQLILQFLQGDPNNEVAWLWLASVAADSAEYVRALNEVLRINPENQRARSLLDEYYQQQSAASDASAPSAISGVPASPYARPSASPPSIPVPDASASPPPVQTYTPPPASDQWQQAPPYQGYAQMAPIQPQQPVYVETERVVEKQRGRGCMGCGPGCLGMGGCLGCGGCGQGCLLALVLLVIVPMIACGALAYSPRSLGPLDVVLGMLPDEFGRKTIEIRTLDYREADGQSFTISASVPRSWLLLDPDDPVWEILAEATDETLPFADINRSWLDEADDANLRPIILDMNYVYLSEGGDLTRLELAGTPESGNFRCETIESTRSEGVYRYDDDLCGYRVDEVIAFTGQPIFDTIDPPEQLHVVTFYTPARDDLALKWTLTLPEGTVYDWYKNDIDVLIKSVTISQ